LLTLFLFGIFHFLPGNPKALTVPNVQLHLMEDVLDDVGRLSESKSQIIRINQPSRGGGHTAAMSFTEAALYEASAFARAK
jgi:hypothetical protein